MGKIKLSVPQAAVVGMMEEGWVLMKNVIKHPKCAFTTEVNTVTISALERKGIIAWTGLQYHLIQKTAPGTDTGK